MAVANRAMVSSFGLVCFAVVCAVLVCIEPVEGLTAFGKTNQKKDTDQTAKPSKRAKPCSHDSECLLRFTSCQYNQIEGKKHCTCPDGSVPDNGECKLKGLPPGKDCTTGKCAPGSDCLFNKTYNKKICVCEDGFFDDESTQGFRFCNGASILFLPDATSLLLGFAVYGAIRTLLHSH